MLFELHRIFECPRLSFFGGGGRVGWGHVCGCVVV